MGALLHPCDGGPLWIEYGFSISPQSPPCPIVSALKPHIRAVGHKSCNTGLFVCLFVFYSELKKKVKYFFYPCSFLTPGPLPSFTSPNQILWVPELATLAQIEWIVVGVRWDDSQREIKGKGAGQAKTRAVHSTPAFKEEETEVQRG